MTSSGVPPLVPQGISLRAALDLARKLGLAVFKPPRTGEVVIRDGTHSVRHNARRHDASRKLVALLRAAVRRRTGENGSDR